MLYSLYGLWLRSNLPIPGLISLPEAPRLDVRICLGSMPSWLNEIPKVQRQIRYVSACQDELGEPALTVWKLRTADGVYFQLVYPDGTEFLSDLTGSRIWAMWPAPLTLEDTSMYLLGPVLGILLRLRGVSCLHASAVALGERAVAFLGDAGAGKSTTAAAFAKRSHPVLSDDIVALVDLGDGFLVQPGYPCIRLWSDSVNFLFGSPNALPLLTPTWDKHFLDLRDENYRFQQEPLPLGAIYVLDSEARYGPASSANAIAPPLEAISAADRLLTLIANTFANRFLDRAMRAQEFEILSRLVRSVPVRRINLRNGSADPLKACDVIIDDFLSL